MFISEDVSVKEHGYGSALCNICACYRTSILHYGDFTSYISEVTGLKSGYICLICQGKLGDE